MINNEKDEQRKAIKRKAMRVRCGGVKHVDAAEKAEDKNEKTENKKVSNNGN